MNRHWKRVIDQQIAIMWSIERDVVEIDDRNQLTLEQAEAQFDRVVAHAGDFDGICQLMPDGKNPPDGERARRRYNRLCDECGITDWYLTGFCKATLALASNNLRVMHGVPPVPFEYDREFDFIGPFGREQSPKN